MQTAIRAQLALALALLAAVPAGGAVAAGEAAPIAAGADPFQATVTRVVKRVEWQRSATKLWQKAFVESMLLVGDGLRTGADSRAELQYGDGSVTRVGSMTTLTLTGAGKRELHLDAGKLWLHIQKGGAGMKVITPGAVAAVTGTELLVEVDPIAKTTEVTVFEGAVNVTGDVGDLVKVIGGSTTRVPFHAPAIVPIPIDQRKMQERDTMFRTLSLPEASSDPGTKTAGNGEIPVGPKPQASAGPDGRGPNGKGPDGKGPDGRGPDGKGPDGKGPDGNGPDGRGPDKPAVDPASAEADPVQPDMKGQTKKLFDPRIIGGSPTTGRVRVVIE